MKEATGFLCGTIIGLIIMLFVVIDLTRDEVYREAVQSGHGYYHPETAEFTWHDHED